MYDFHIRYTTAIENSKLQTVFTDEIKHNIFASKGFRPDQFRSGPVPESASKDRILNLVSENKKIILDYTNNFYPYVAWFLGQILLFYSDKSNRDVHLEILYRNLGADRGRVILDDFINYLSDLYGFKVTWHEAPLLRGVEANNFALLQLLHTVTIYPKFVYEELLNIIKSDRDGEDPHKKVFISRKKRHDKAPNWDKRSDSDEDLENLFLSMGFEILYAEDFSNFVDQILYFRKVKTLAGVTGAGLTNAVFMPPGGNVIELLTVLNFNDDIRQFSEVHDYYRIISLFKDHMYVSVSNASTKAEDLLSNQRAIELIKKVSE
jgi:hypothetical protein